MTLSPSFVSHNQAVWARAAGTDWVKSAVHVSSSAPYRLTIRIRSDDTIRPNTNTLFGQLFGTEANTKRIFGTFLVFSILKLFTAVIHVIQTCHCPMSTAPTMLQIVSGLNGSVTLAMDWRKEEGILGDGSRPVESRGEDPITGLMDDPQADTYFGNGCKTDILRNKNRKCIHVSLFS